MYSRFCYFIPLLLATLFLSATLPARAQSDLYIVNYFSNKITRHNPSTGALVSTFDISRPSGAQLGPDGNLYVVSYDRTLRRYNSATGVLLATLATNIATFPDDLKFGPDGNIYVLCEFGPGILRYDINGNPRPSANNTGATFFYGPSNRFGHCDFGADGSLYVSDFGANQVFRFSSLGALLGTFVSTDLNGPGDLKFGPDGSLYVANRDTNDVRKFNGNTGAFLGVFASGHGLDKVDGFDFGPDGNIYVSGRISNTVVRFDGRSGAFIDTFISSGLDDPYLIRFSGIASPFRISGITPNGVVVNSAAFQMTINGSGLSPNPIVRFNNTQLTVVSATNSRVVVNVPAHLLTAIRNYNVTVSVNGKLSNAVPFRVSANLGGPPNLKISPVYRTGRDELTGNKYAVLLLENQGSSDITTINLSNVRLYYDSKRDPGKYIQPVNITLEQGALPPGTLSRTRPGERLQIRFDFPSTNEGPVSSGTLSIIGTSDQGGFNAGSLFLFFN